VLRFVLLIAGTAAFVWLTALSLPDVVASHFGASVQANGFMSVVRAKGARPPHLSSSGIGVGLAAFGAYSIVWTRLLVRRFRNRPSGRSE
jgi:hypothetical protein